MTVAAALPVGSPTLNRALGQVVLSTKPGPALDRLFQKGALKVVFPRADDLTAVLVNTAGGITGGDRFDVDIHARASMTVTTQASERAYRARQGEVGHVETRLRVGPDARLHWLPQETILFDGCALERKLNIEVEPGGELLVVEPLIFGRTAMGETQVSGSLRERIEINRNGAPLYRDAWSLAGDLSAQMDRPALGAGARAMATLILVSGTAEARQSVLRQMLPDTGGVSLIGPDLLVARILAADSYTLRRDLLPILDLLTNQSLPTCWRL